MNKASLLSCVIISLLLLSFALPKQENQNLGNYTTSIEIPELCQRVLTANDNGELASFTSIEVQELIGMIDCSIPNGPIRPERVTLQPQEQAEATIAILRKFGEN
jgi:hypothetical protein